MLFLLLRSDSASRTGGASNKDLEHPPSKPCHEHVLKLVKGSVNDAFPLHEEICTRMTSLPLSWSWPLVVAATESHALTQSCTHHTSGPRSWASGGPNSAEFAQLYACFSQSDFSPEHRCTHPPPHARAHSHAHALTTYAPLSIGEKLKGRLLKSSFDKRLRIDLPVPLLVPTPPGATPPPSYMRELGTVTMWQIGGLTGKPCTFLSKVGHFWRFGCTKIRRDFRGVGGTFLLVLMPPESRFLLEIIE